MQGGEIGREKCGFGEKGGDRRQQAECCISWTNLLLATWQESLLKVCFSLALYVLHPAGSIKQMLLRQCVYNNIVLPLERFVIISLPPSAHNTQSN